MVYKRRIKKGGKVYTYFYKSQRVGDKVKSIYIGKSLEKEEKPKRPEPKDRKIVSSLVEFDQLLEKVQLLIQKNDVDTAIDHYHKLFQMYSNLDVEVEDKYRLFRKLNNVYNDLNKLRR